MISITEIMSKDIVTIEQEAPIYEALDLLSKRKISGIPVINEQNNIVGILTEKDVLKILIDKNLGVKTTVSQYMTREVICFTEDDNAFDICKFFIRSNIRRVPILKDGKIVGIVSRRDIVELILEAQRKISDFRYV